MDLYLFIIIMTVLLIGAGILMLCYLHGCFENKHKCDHEFGDWQVTSSMTSESWGVRKVFQARKCKKCGFTQNNCQELG